jgi:hypothetical protein
MTLFAVGVDSAKTLAGDWRKSGLQFEAPNELFSAFPLVMVSTAFDTPAPGIAEEVTADI